MDRWLFLHVMKTAGTSFLYDDRGAARRGRLSHRQRDQGPAERLVLRRRRTLTGGSTTAGSTSGARRVFCGHYAARLVEALPARIAGRWRTVTFLRDPVARTLSRISQSDKYRPGIPGLRRFRPVRISRALDDPAFVESQVRDYQTKVFAMEPAGDVNAPWPGRRRAPSARRRRRSPPPTSSA